jgi:hypothetical protein
MSLIASGISVTHEGVNQTATEKSQPGGNNAACESCCCEPKLNAAFVDQISLKAHQALERSFLMPVLEWFCNDMSELV